MVTVTPLVPARLAVGVLVTWRLCWEECCGKPGAGLPRERGALGVLESRWGRWGEASLPMDVRGAPPQPQLRPSDCAHTVPSA